MKEYVLLLILLTVIACSSTNDILSNISPISTVTPQTYDIFEESLPRPKSGKSVVFGRILSIKSGKPLSNVIVRMAEVYYQNDAKKSDNGIYVLDNAFSPYTVTNNNGVFVFDNIEPRDYVLFVGDVAVKYTIVTRSDGKPKVWTVKGDEITYFGDIMIDY
jgi:hypothetical protein